MKDYMALALPAVIILAAFASASAHASELAIPDATKKREIFTQPDTPAAPVAMGSIVGASPAPKLILPAPPPPLSSSGGPAEANGPDALRALAITFSSWQVAAVLDDIVIMRNAEKSLSLLVGKEHPYLDGVKLLPKLNGSTVELVAIQGDTSRVVFVGQLKGSLAADTAKEATKQ